MIKRLFGFLFLIAVMNSCDSFFYSHGVVIDNETSTPIENALITIKGSDTIFTDSLGKFKIEKPMFGIWTDCEIMIEKKGYLPQYVNFTKDSYDQDSTVIKIQPTNKEFKPALSKSSISFMYYFNMIVLSIFNLFTIIFIVAYKDLRRRFLWMIGIMFINITVYLLYLDCSIVHFSIINGPVYFTHYWTHPYSVKIVFPVVSIIFWILFIFKRELILKDEDEY